ncbi:MAG: DivIVA domain-containing protein, partial [Gemmatimonadetes bacterium]|nr:DivIVA domain-containing protein [Gemmatimonadota bacterium]
LAEQLKQFKDRDKAFNDALVSAQQLRAEIREQAERESQLILREARAEGDRQLDGAKAEIRRLTAEIESLERVRRSYLLSLKTMVEKQLAEVEALAAAAPPGADAVRKADEAGGNGAAPAERKSGSWLDTMVRE